MSEELGKTTVVQPPTDVGPPRGPQPRANEPKIGSSVGRYLVLELVGRGAMGQVVRAYDPKLQREVAIKLVSNDVLDPNARDRMLREALAMAQLSHPNVVGLYDAEESESGVMLVMELVTGRTLREWTKAAPRAWPEIVERFRAAGRGLAAAHSAGLLHRDFKADNVLVADSGAIKVTDFGLAKLTSTAIAKPTDQTLEPSSVELAETSGAFASSTGASLDSALTHVGTVMGTPRYMAPEQHRGKPLDSRADQYAFCVALWEALAGRAPFPEGRLTTLIARKHRGAPPWPEGAPRVPRPIEDALRRGLSPKPTDRWPGMEELIETLDHDPSRRRSRRWLGLAGLAVVGLVVGATQAWLERRAARCTGAAEQLEGVWDPSRRAEVEAALLGTKAAYAPSVWERTRAALDDHADAWVAMHTESCEATTLRGEQSAEVMDLRMGCLIRARTELEAVVDVLAHGDVEVVDNADDMVSGLAPLSRCADGDALRASVEPPRPEEADAVERIGRRLAEARALRDGGRFTKGLEAVELAEIDLAEIDYGPAITEVALERGRALEPLGRYAESEAALREALESGLRWRQLGLVQQTAVELLLVVGARQWRTTEALQLRELALALADDPEAEANARDGMAEVLSARGEYEAAVTEYRRALDLHETVGGPDHPQVATTRTSLAVVLDQQGEHEAAVQQSRRALGSLERALGPDHPDTAHARNNLGLALHGAGRYEEAEAQLRSALVLHERIFGPKHPQVAGSRNNLGLVLERRGRADEAEAEHRLALELRTKALGIDHPDVAQSWNNLALALYAQGKPEQAEVEQRRALELQRQALGPEHPDVAQSTANLGLMLDAQGKSEDGEAELRRALALQQKVLGPEHPRVALSHNNLGLTLYSQGKLEAAEQQMRRALELHEARLGSAHPIVALSHNNVAQILSDRGRPTEALAEHRRALALYEEALGPEHPEVAMSRNNIAVILRRQGELESAEIDQRRALEIWEQTLAADHPNVALARHNLADVLYERQRYEEALPLIEASWERRQRDDTRPMYQASTGFLLARTLWKASSRAPDRARARQLAARALDQWQRLGNADDVEVVRAWLEDPSAPPPEDDDAP